MKPLRMFHVRPALPPRLQPLHALAMNLRWAWDHETISLFRRLDRDLWEETGHNPVLMLAVMPQSNLEAAAGDEAFLAHLDRVDERLREYLGSPTPWYRQTFGPEPPRIAAYFSMEFGITECMQSYSGGLGILAGDHLKSASDLGVPMVGVGLLYQKGYFRQYLNAEGWQQELYPTNDFHTMPVELELDDQGAPVTVSVDIQGRRALAQVWRAQVGRVPLFLLDTNIPENPQDIQDITDELYGGDLENRIRQELLLGVGGMRVLDRLGMRARVYHMNEGHCAFLALERIRLLMAEQGLSFGEAREVVGASTVFTTHTPVPAGIDVFPADLIERYFGSYREELGLTAAEFLGLGSAPGDSHPSFNMAILAIHTSCFVNGVSRLHGRVARQMWKEVWPGVPLEEVPIAHVTNGIHPGSWISDDMAYLYDRYLGPGWAEVPSESETWRRGARIPGSELWRTHERRRERLVAFTRRRLVEQLRKRGAGKAVLHEAESALDPKALTLGFARRFATYKRAGLILRDPERLASILNAPGRPVQLIFAGRAHPRDEEGKAIIRDIIHLAARPEFRRRIVFLEDYDAVIARYMVQGSDVWLNTPRRPLEASGTSGMKAAFNGGLNLSILDGWWDEACSPRTGWGIGRGEEYRDLEYQDRVEAGALYDLLEHEVAPLFYDRSPEGLPEEWIELMKSAMSDLCPVFNTNRMVVEYVIEAYHLALEQRRRMEEDGCRRARAVAAWRERVRHGWDAVKFLTVEADIPEEALVGTEFEVRVRVDPGSLDPGELAVQAYLGKVDDRQQITGGSGTPLDLDPGASPPGALFRGKVHCGRSGYQGLTVRMMPHHEGLPHEHCLMRVKWAD